MEGFFYLLDLICVIWLLVMVRRNDLDSEAMKKGELGIFSMRQQTEKPAGHKKPQGKF